MTDQQIPIQPVENPILCSPYVEPDQHWLYDTRTGIPTRTPGRRPASYWFKSERTGSAQQQMSFLAEEERDDLPLVNALREDVKRWRESGWEGASETTKRLLRHWSREDRTRRLFFCQIEAVETIIYLREVLAQGRKPRWNPKLSVAEFKTLSEGGNPRPKEWVAKIAQHPKLADFPNETGLKPIGRYAAKMATGSGKTVVMAMLIAWAFCNRGTKPGDPRFPRRTLVVCPNLTIKERLNVLRPGDPDNYYDKFDLVPTSLRPEIAKGKVLVTNWHWFNPESEVIKVGGVTVGRLGEETPEAFAQNRLGDLWDTEPLMVLNDEGHHAYRPAPVPEGVKLSAIEKADREEATVWVTGLDKINAACGIAFCVDMSATPFYIHGSGYPEGSPFPWVVCDFSLVDAIESGITKIPRLPAIDNTGRPDPKYFKLWDHITRDLKAGEKLSGGKPKPEVVYRKAEDALLTLAGEWKERFDQISAAAPGQERKAFEIRFPIVEGYVVDLKRNIVKCDVGQVERIGLDPWNTPTAAFVRPQVGYQVGHPGAHTGFGFELVDRQAYYDSVHPQTITFEIAREIVRMLTEASHPGKERLKRQGRRALFPQVLRIVQEYVATRVDFNGCHPCEVGLQTYAQRITGVLVAAIEPDDERGEAPLLPRLNRYKPIGSTQDVHFKTVKPVQATLVSHLNLIACDTGSWEQAAAMQLEMLAKRHIVICYARNDHMEFNIPYELYGIAHVYEPDFPVRLANGVTVILEIKGQPGDSDAKHQAARRWMAAVNHWGRLGTWDFLPCHNPQLLGQSLSNLATLWEQRVGRQRVG